MSCSQVRRELLEHLAFREELGPRSGPHLAHLESCADCRQEVGIDRELVRVLRRALRERVEGSAPSEATWELVRRRTVDRPVRPWTVLVRQWGGIASAAAAGIMMFAVATGSATSPLPGPHARVISPASRAVAPLEESGGWLGLPSNTYGAPEVNPPLPGWPVHTQRADDLASIFGDPPITSRMQ